MVMKMIKNIMKYYIRNKDSSFVLMLTLIFFLGFFEFIGIGLFIPLLDNSDSIINAGLNSIFDFINIQRNDLTISIFIFIIFFIKVFVVIGFNKKQSYLMNHFVYKVRSEIVKNLTVTNYIKLQNYSTGELNNLVTKESEKIAEGYTYTLDILLKVFLILIYLSLSLLTNVYATLFAILLGILFVLGFKKIVYLSRVYSKVLLESNEKTNSYISEFLHGLKYLYATNGFKNVNKKLNNKLYDYSQAKYKLDYYGKLSKVIPEPIGVLIIISVLIVNYLYIHNSTMSVLMSAVLLYKTFQNIAALQYVYQKLIGVSASVEKVNSFEEELIIEKEQNGTCIIEKVDSISFNSLDFNFSDKKILNHLDLTFSRGNSYAFVGESGAGKTTILNILTLLYSVKKDFYMINYAYDSNDIDKYNFRLKVGYVSQEPIYFDGSIKENIVLNLEDVDEEYLYKIIKLVKLNDIVKDKGLDTKLQSFGKDLSGGQLQRINIARELIKKPDILILDEATSALDANTEKEIMSNILELKKEMIVIIVAHRLSSLIEVNEILFLKQGTVVAKDNMNNLYQKSEEFKVMCNNQNIFLDVK
jgi:ABC-type multidrug transport system fused ATPase/permease subunit